MPPPPSPASRSPSIGRADGEHVLVIEQGFEMGRPSRIVLGFEVGNAALRSASIGGEAVIVSSGTLDL